MAYSRMQAAEAPHRDELTELLISIRLGDTLRIGADAFVPLLSAFLAGDPLADLLEEGILAERTVLREVSEAGHVNRIYVRHDGERPLLLVDGEQIIGAKQNRVLNASFLVPAGDEVEVPVSCVERGRWQYASRTFAASETTLTGMARSRKVSRVTHSVINGLGYDAQQGAVWRDVDEYIERSQVVSRTSALEDALRSKRNVVEKGLAALRPREEQVGVALVRAGALVLLDLFGTAHLYARAHRKVLRGMLADASEEGQAPPGARRAVADALATLSGAELQRVKAPGSGDTLHGRFDGYVGSVLVSEGRVYHAVIAAA